MNDKLKQMVDEHMNPVTKHSLREFLKEHLRLGYAPNNDPYDNNIYVKLTLDGDCLGEIVIPREQT